MSDRHLLWATLHSWATRGVGDPAAVAEAGRLAGGGPRTVVLVEGVSDREALAALAERRGRDLPTERIAVLPMGGATNIGRYLALFRSQAPGIRLAGLCDAGEEAVYRRALGRNGFGDDLSRARMAAAGFFVCVADLEDELIRALGTDGVEDVVDALGETRRFRSLRHQEHQRDRAREQQLHRFLGTTSGRKARYARALASALDPAAVPPPLAALLASLRSPTPDPPAVGAV